MINFISYFGYGGISLFLAHYEIISNPDLITKNLGGIKYFSVQVLKVFLDFLIIGYPAYMHVKNFSGGKEHR